MAKVKIKGRKNLEKGLSSDIKGFLKDKNSMDKVAKVLEVELKDELIETPQPDVSSQWAKRRDKLSKTNKVSKYRSTGNKSNIHFTGKLVSSLKAENEGSGKFKLEYTGTHKSYSYKDRNGKTKRTKAVRNSTIAEGLSSKGFKVLFLPRLKAPERILGLFKRYLKRKK